MKRVKRFKSRLDELEEEIERAEEHLRALKDLKVALERLAIVDADIPQTKGKPKRAYGLMVRALRESGNRWLTMLDFERLTGCSTTAMRQVLYRQNADEFDKKIVGPGTITAYRLKRPS